MHTSNAGIPTGRQLPDAGQGAKQVLLHQSASNGECKHKASGLQVWA